MHAGKEEVEAEVAEATATANPSTSGGDEEFDWEEEEDEEADEGEEGEAVSADDEPRELRAAGAWDSFFGLCFSMRPFERDDREYREARAVETFNAAGKTMAAYKELNPSAQSACPHVALVVVTRQMVADGDPGRRGTDHSESFGAQIKDGIHWRCLRRKLAKTATQHKRWKADGSTHTWMQKPLAVSRVMQAFRDIAVRERLLRDEDSTPWLQRKHFRTQATGFATVGEAVACEPCEGEPEVAEPRRVVRRRPSTRRSRRAGRRGGTLHEQARLGASVQVAESSGGARRVGQTQRVLCG